jgi:hypothetical protein
MLLLQMPRLAAVVSPAGSKDLIVYCGPTQQRTSRRLRSEFFAIMGLFWHVLSPLRNGSYMSHMGSIIAGAEITRGGPVILVQPENE